MTENEAVYILEMNRPFAYSELQEALDVAIDNLEEIQQYRAIGTIEEFRKLRKMFGDDFPEMSEVVKRILKEYPEYQSIGTVEEIQALKEKNVAKEMETYYCPICRHYFEDGEVHNYCPDCGQKLDWQ